MQIIVTKNSRRYEKEMTFAAPVLVACSVHFVRNLFFPRTKEMLNY